MSRYIKYIKTTAAKNYKTLLLVPAIGVLSVNSVMLLNKGQNPLNLSNYSNTVLAQSATANFPLHNTTGYSCDVDEWHFIVNQIQRGQTLPAYITVTWSDGSSLQIPRDLTKSSATAAHFTMDLSLEIYSRYANLTPTGGFVTMYASWTGQFNTSHGPCAVTPAPTTMPTVAPTSTPTVMPTSTPTTVPTVIATVDPTATPTTTPTTVATVAPTTAPIATATPEITKEAAFTRAPQGEVLGVTSEITATTMPDTSAKVSSESNLKNIVYAFAALFVSVVVIASDRIKNLKLTK